MPTSNKCLLIVAALVLIIFVMVDRSNADTGYAYTDMKPERDCAVHKFQSDNTSIGFKLGTFLIGVGPEVSWGSQSGINWNYSIQSVIVRYEQLCADYNSGILSKSEYLTRLDNIDSFYNDYQENQYKHQNELFDQLDRETKEVFKR